MEAPPPAPDTPPSGRPALQLSAAATAARKRLSSTGGGWANGASTQRLAEAGITHERLRMFTQAFERIRASTGAHPLQGTHLRLLPDAQLALHARCASIVSGRGAPMRPDAGLCLCGDPTAAID